MPRPFGRSLISLDGLSVGDAFGQRFFGNPGVMWARISQREVPHKPWIWTDDTAMARVIVACLRDEGELEPDTLSRRFANEYHLNPGRGYGSGAAQILNQISHRTPWREAAGSVFGGQGSKGNGAAMRAAPVGAYFADDLAKVVEQATISAEVTHLYPEGIAGAVAVALAAAWAARGEGDLWDTVLAYLGEGTVRDNVEKARALPTDLEPSRAAGELGSGNQVLAEDTVGFCIWCVARSGNNFEEAMWTTVAGMGDRDTTCAIVGGIVAVMEGAELPEDWLLAREPLNLSKAG